MLPLHHDGGSSVGAQGGSRTHTDQLLRLAPLPIGLPEPVSGPGSRSRTSISAFRAQRPPVGPTRTVWWSTWGTIPAGALARRVYGPPHLLSGLMLLFSISPPGARGGTRTHARHLVRVLLSPLRYPGLARPVPARGFEPRLTGQEPAVLSVTPHRGGGVRGSRTRILCLQGRCSSVEPGPPFSLVRVDGIEPSPRAPKARRPPLPHTLSEPSWLWRLDSNRHLPA